MFGSNCATDKEFVQHLKKKLEQRGVIELIMGTMFAGKSTELLRRTRLHEVSGKSILRIKFSADHRYGMTDISTHTGQSTAALPLTKLEECGDDWRKYDVIGIDEGQFFSDLVPFCEKLANA